MRDFSAYTVNDKVFFSGAEKKEEIIIDGFERDMIPNMWRSPKGGRFWIKVGKVEIIIHNKVGKVENKVYNKVGKIKGG